jgi:hypothetical protein
MKLLIMQLYPNSRYFLKAGPGEATNAQSVDGEGLRKTKC